MHNLDDIKRYVLSKYPDGIIIDTNILFLLLIGSYKTELIKNCSLFTDNEKNYSVEDFELLKEIITIFGNKLVITPQIIAELSSKSISSKVVPVGDFLPYLNAVISLLRNAEEKHQKAECLWGMQLEILGRFGFTDMTIYELAKNTKIPVLTDELDLHLHLEKTNIPNIKFQDIKNSQLGIRLIS